MRAGKRDWFRFENKAGETASIYLFDEVSFFGVNATDFTRELVGVSAKTIDLHINSPGGDVFDGITIYNQLKQHSATVNVIVDGIAASIASVIAMAGDRIEMSRGSLLMIHEPFALVIGDSTDFRKQADALDVMGDSIAGIYASRAGSSADHWRGLMREETWFGDQAAVDSGLADCVGGQVATKNVFDLSIFRNYRPTGAPPPAPEGTAAVTPEEKPAPGGDDWRRRAKRRLAAAQMEVVVHANAH